MVPVSVVWKSEIRFWTMLTNTQLIAIVQIRMSFWKVRETLARTLFWFLIQLILQKGAHVGVPAITRLSPLHLTLRGKPKWPKEQTHIRNFLSKANPRIHKNSTYSFTLGTPDPSAGLTVADKSPILQLVTFKFLLTARCNAGHSECMMWEWIRHSTTYQRA